MQLIVRYNWRTFKRVPRRRNAGISVSIPTKRWGKTNGNDRVRESCGKASLQAFFGDGL